MPFSNSEKTKRALDLTCPKTQMPFLLCADVIKIQLKYKAKRPLLLGFIMTWVEVLTYRAYPVVIITWVHHYLGGGAKASKFEINR